MGTACSQPHATSGVERRSGKYIGDRMVVTEPSEPTNDPMSSPQSVKEAAQFPDSPRFSLSPQPRVDSDLSEALESQLKEGDGLLIGLSQTCPESRPEVSALLTESSRLRKDATDFKQFKAYFDQRYKLMNAIWTNSLRVKNLFLSSCARVNKTMEASIQGLGILLGEDTDAIKELKETLKNLEEKKDADFLNEFLSLHIAISRLQIDHFTQKIEREKAEKLALQASLSVLTNCLRKSHMKSLFSTQNRVFNELKIRFFRWKRSVDEDRYSQKSVRFSEMSENPESARKPGGFSGLQSLDASPFSPGKRIVFELAEEPDLIENHVRVVRREIELYLRQFEEITEPLRTLVSSTVLNEGRNRLQGCVWTGEEGLIDIERNIHHILEATQINVQNLVSIWRDQAHRSETDLARLETTYSAQIQTLESQLESGNSAMEEFEGGKLMEELGNLKDEIKVKNQEIERLKTVEIERKSELEDSRRKIIALQRDSEHLISEMQSLRQQVSVSEADVNNLSAQVTHFSYEISSRDEYLKGLSEDMRIREAKSGETMKLKSLKGILSHLNLKIESVKRLSLAIWARTQFSESMNSSFLLERALNESETSICFEGNLAENKEVELIIVNLKQEMRAKNVLLETFEKAQGCEKPFSPVQLQKFFEDMMDRKYESDLIDLKSGRSPKAIPSFVLEYLTRMFGLRRLAIKTLCQIMPSLQNCCAQGHPFAVLFCQLAQVYHQVPVPTHLSVFLTKRRMEFAGFIEKYQKERSKVNPPSPEAKHYPFTGGEASLSDVVPYIYSLFEGDRRSGELMIRRLRPDSIPVTEYVLFNLCLRISKMAVNPDHLFSVLDFGRNEMALIRSVRRSLDLWVSYEELEIALRSLLSPNSSLSQVSLTGKINFQMCVKYARNPEFVTNKYAFLLSLISVYEQKELVYISQINSVLDNSWVSLSWEQFSRVIRRLEPSVSQEKLTFLFQEAVGQTAGFNLGMSIERLMQVLVRNPVGSMARSVFRKTYTDVKETVLEQNRQFPESPDALRRTRRSSTLFAQRACTPTFFPSRESLV